MTRGDASRSRVLASAGPEQKPERLFWKSKELFRLRGGDAELNLGAAGTVRLDLPPIFDLTIPIIANDIIYFTLNIHHGYFYALNASTGEQIVMLRFDQNGLSAPAALGTTAFFGTRTGRVYAYDVQTKSVKWSYQDEHGSFVSASPAIDGGVVYFCAEDIGAYAFIAKTGAVKWTFRSKDNVYGPAIGSDKVILLTAKGLLIALDKDSGTKAWEAKIDRDTITPAVYQQHIILVHDRGEIQSRSIADGSLQWRSKKYGGASGSAALIDGKVFYGGREDSTVALDVETGLEKWRFKTNRPCGSPVIAARTLYVSCEDHKIYALDLDTGAEKWHYDNKKGTAPTPTFANGIMYVLVPDGYVYAVK